MPSDAFGGVALREAKGVPTTHRKAEDEPQILPVRAKPLKKRLKKQEIGHKKFLERAQRGGFNNGKCKLFRHMSEFFAPAAARRAFLTLGRGCCTPGGVF
jgi:hypothetical protein